MPNRMLRDWTMSDKVNSLTVNAERFFTRLIMKVDDHGCFHADARLLKANLYPLLLDAVREADISRWMAECQKAGLIVLYECNSKKYVQILDFRQRLDKARSKYPLPNSTDFPVIVNEFPGEAERKLEPEENTKEAGTLPTSTADFEKRQKSFYESLKPFVETYGKEMLRKFYDYWREPNKSKSKMRWEQERTWDLSLRLKKWEDNEARFKTGTGVKNEPKDTKKLSAAVAEIRKEQGAA